MPLAAALNAPLPHGFSPVRRLRRRTALSALRSSPPHKSPTPGATHRAAPLVGCIGEHLGGAAKPRSGVRRQRHLRRRGPQSAWPRTRSVRFKI